MGSVRPGGGPAAKKGEDSTMRRWLTALVVAGLAGSAVAWAAPAASAAAGCLVVDTNSNQSYPSLQDAVNAPATSPGDTLFVKRTCTGVTDITKSLTITGQSNGGQKTATLNGGSVGGAATGSVLTIEAGVTVTLNRLVITNGVTGCGGGICDLGGTVTLNGSTVTGNTGFAGGGIDNFEGTLTLNNSTVTGNHARNVGGGICNGPGATVTLAGSSTVTGNTAAFSVEGLFGGGIWDDPQGTLVNAIAPPAPGANVFNNTPDNISNGPLALC
jgi:hypothetical protein